MHRVFPFVLLLAGVVAPSGVTPAQSYPAKPIRVIVPAQAGGTCDTLTRLIGQKMAERLGQGMIVDNRPGAGGILGLEITAKLPPDGYNIACGQGGNLVIVPHTFKKLPYDPLKDFAPVALLATNYLALVIHPSAPFKSVKELIAYAKVNPGKLSFASNGEGAFIHLTTEQFRTQAGFTYLHVPYKGIAQYTTELLGGRVDAVITAFTAVYPYVRSGKLRVLAITKPTRAANYPDIPTMAETLPGFSAGGWFGFIAPAATPGEIVSLLNREINRAMGLPDVREKMIAYGLDIATESPEFFGETIRSDYVKYGRIVREIGLKPQ
jgi:tripartite-type tricarboxylate transporter receptor subunit TctC